ncbi:MAG: alpha/beta fold hydrolase [Chloroflexota bacterium]|nr:alpha/beta fold hydrolase [Chloroflexota bacterium]
MNFAQRMIPSSPGKSGFERPCNRLLAGSLDSPNLILVTREEGTGSPILFLHALGASSRYFAGRLGTLPLAYHCVMPDLLGFGRSPKPEIAYTVEDHLAALQRTLDRLRLTDQPIVLVGHSLGAILAVEYAARFPDQVRGLVLLALPLYRSRDEAQRYIIAHGAWMARMTVLNGRIAHTIHMVMATFRPLVALLAGRLTTGLPPEIAEDAIRHTWASYSGTLAHCVLSHDLAPALRALPRIPILAVHGDADPAAPLAAVQTLAGQMPTITLHILPGQHHLFLTQHHTCLAAIEGFLTALPLDPPKA